LRRESRARNRATHSPGFSCRHSLRLSGGGARLEPEENDRAQPRNESRLVDSNL